MIYDRVMLALGVLLLTVGCGYGGFDIWWVDAAILQSYF